MKSGASIAAAALAAVLACARSAPPDGPSSSPVSQPARSHHLLPTGLPQPPVDQAGLRLDLYLPSGSVASPLLVFALGGRWSMPDRNYMVGAALGDAMQRRGIATAVIR